jgi:hypothetical protein
MGTEIIEVEGCNYDEDAIQHEKLKYLDFLTENNIKNIDRGYYLIPSCIDCMNYQHGDYEKFRMNVEYIHSAVARNVGGHLYNPEYSQLKFEVFKRTE